MISIFSFPCSNLLINTGLMSFSSTRLISPNRSCDPTLLELEVIDFSNPNGPS